MRRMFYLGAALAALTAPAAAQDYDLDPTYGETSLSSGFTPDPFTVELRSGGLIDVDDTRLPSNCRGWIADAPDYRMEYDAGGFDLTFSVSSESDTTLVVNTPDGEWLCDDDSGGYPNPRITVDDPQSGQYDIWVGSYGQGGGDDATLSVSELGLASGGGTPDLFAEPNFGSTSLNSESAPFSINLTSGGGIDASNVDFQCAGYISEAADFELTYTAGSGPLVMNVDSDGDTTLVVNTPNGEWVCDDDGGQGVNPRLVFNPAASGVYDIWVGSYSSGDFESAVLEISSPRK